MSEAFSCIWPKGWLWCHQTFDEVACFVTSHGSAQSSGWKAQLACGVSFDLAWAEWMAPCKYLESHDTNGPDVHSFRVCHFLTSRVGSVFDNALHLWSHVQRRASSSACNCVTVDGPFTESEVRNFHPPLRAGGDYQNVLYEIVSANVDLSTRLEIDIRLV